MIYNTLRKSRCVSQRCLKKFKTLFSNKIKKKAKYWKRQKKGSKHFSSF